MARQKRQVGARARSTNKAEVNIDALLTACSTLKKEVGAASEAGQQSIKKLLAALG